MKGLAEIVGGFGGRLVRAFGEAKGLGQQAVAQPVPTWQRSAGVDPAPQSPSDIARYATSDDVYAAVNACARKAATIPWQVYVGGDLDDEHDLGLLLNRANGEIGGYAFWLQVYSWLWLIGDMFVVIERDNPVDARIPNSLWPVPGRMIKPRVDKSAGMVVDYAVVDPDTQEPLGILPREDVVPLQLWNPANPFRGLSPLSSLRLGLDSEHYAKQANRNLFLNGMMTDGILWLEGVQDQIQLDQIKHQIENRKRGVSHAHSLLYLATAGRLDKLQLTPADAQFLELDLATTRDVCKAYSIPPTWLADFERATYENVAAADAQGWENGVMPIVRLVAGALTVRLGPMFDTDIEVVPDVSQVPALQDDQQALAAVAKTLVEAGADPLWAFRRVFGEEVPDEAVAAPEPVPSPAAPAAAPVPEPEPPEPPEPAEKAAGHRADRLREARDREVRSALAAIDAALESDSEAVWRGVKDVVADTWRASGKAVSDAAIATALDALLNQLRRGSRSVLAIALHGVVEDALKAGGKSLSDLWRVAADDRDVATVAARFARETAAAKVTAITNEDRLALRAAIADAIDGSETLADALDNGRRSVHETLRGIEDPTSRGYGARVERITMTEVGGAWNRGAYEVMQQAGIEQHQWIYSGKATSRHEALHGTTRRIGETWDVNGHAGLYPGDSNLPPGETINCECVVVPVGA